jgi:NTP pyrophosphatase (non-canonical NTP hydrolase)
VRLVRVVAVDVRPEAAVQPGETRNLPEVREELLDLLLQLVCVASAHRPTPYLAASFL